MELSFLKAQINPHFLFNAFNNLYTLIVKGDQQAAMILADFIRCDAVRIVPDG